MKFLKNKTLWIIGLISLLGLAFRLIGINKPEGLTPNEYGFVLAALEPLKNIFKGLLNNPQMPAFYIYIKAFTKFFTTNDLALRLNSVILGIISVIAMYFAGKEFKDTKFGLLTGFFASCSAFLIFTSQNVTPNSWIFLISTLILLLTIRLKKEQNSTNLILFTLLNAILIFTHNIGFIFTLLNLIFVTFLVEKKDTKIKLWIYNGILLLLLLPLALITAKTGLNQNLTQFKFWQIFKVPFDLLTPLINSETILSEHPYFFVICGLVPFLIGIAGIVKALIAKDKIIDGLFIVSLVTAVIIFIISAISHTAFGAENILETYPILMLTVAFGLTLFEKHKLNKILLITFFTLSIFYTLLSPVSAPRLKRNSGINNTKQLILNADLNSGDTIILNYYPAMMLKKNLNLKEYKVINIEQLKIKNYKEFLNEQNSKNFEHYFIKNVISKLKTNQKLLIISPNSISEYSPIQIIEIAQSERLYKKTPKLLLDFSYIKNQEFQICLNKLSINKIETNGDWNAMTFKKSQYVK